MKSTAILIVLYCLIFGILPWGVNVHYSNKLEMYAVSAEVMSYEIRGYKVEILEVLEAILD